MFTSPQRYTGSVIGKNYRSLSFLSSSPFSLVRSARRQRQRPVSYSLSRVITPVPCLFRNRYQYQSIMEYTKSTNERYASLTEIFVGNYRYTRALLDYRWHVHYQPERQYVQDTIIKKFLEGGIKMERPWLVYTAGPMGAGKSHTIRYLHKQHVFPLDRFVTVDPDRIKSSLPDMPLYIHYNKTQAGTLTHKESGFIAEIIELEAMKQNKCVLVDGSLRHREWYARWFGRVRAEFPQYRIAILLITASPERVYERAARRALITAREIPKEILDEAIVQVPISFNALAPLADYTATLINDNDTEPPIIQAPETIDTFRQQWDDVYSIPSPLSSTELSTLMLRSESETFASMVDTLDKVNPTANSLSLSSSCTSSSSSSSSSSVTNTSNSTVPSSTQTVSVNTATTSTASSTSPETSRSISPVK